jgi:hypothetical protein
MAEPSFTGADPSDRTPMNTEVWVCPQCRTRGDLVQQNDGVLLRCGKCGFAGRGKPAPNFDVE